MINRDDTNMRASERFHSAHCTVVCVYKFGMVFPSDELTDELWVRGEVAKEARWCLSMYICIGRSSER